MPLVMKDVLSSNVQAVGYDPEKQELYVVWNTSRRSIYSGVPADVAEKAQNAWSVGDFMNSEIKPNYSHRYG